MLRRIDPSSVECVPEGFGFFQTPPTLIAIQKSQYKEILQLNPISDPPFHFKILSGSNFIDWRQSYLYVSMRLKKIDDNGDFVPVEDADNVAIINLLGSTFIRNMKVSVGGQQIYNSNNLYAYKAYLDNELTYNRETKETFLRAPGYFVHSGLNQDLNTDASFTKRKNLVVNGSVFEFISKLHIDAFDQDVYFLNNTEVEIEISPNSADFMVLAPGTKIGGFKFEFLSCKLYVKHLEAQPNASLDIENALLTMPARYGVRRTEIKNLYFEQGRSEVHSTLFTDIVPRRIVCAMVEKDAFNGVKQKSPFNFKPFDVRDIRIMWNGEQNPAVPYEMNWTNNLYMRPYYDMHQALGYAYSNETPGITLGMYKSGWTIFAFNLTSTLEDDDCFDLLKEGATSLHMKFSTDVPAGGIMMIVYAEFDSLMMIDKNRNVKTDLSV